MMAGKSNGKATSTKGAKGKPFPGAKPPFKAEKCGGKKKASAAPGKMSVKGFGTGPGGELPMTKTPIGKPGVSRQGKPSQAGPHKTNAEVSGGLPLNDKCKRV
jgi:hypothetical protein